MNLGPQTFTIALTDEEVVLKSALGLRSTVFVSSTVETRIIGIDHRLADDGFMFHLVNVGTTEITLRGDDESAEPSDRFQCPDDSIIVLRPMCSATVMRSHLLGRFVVLSTTGNVVVLSGSGPGDPTPACFTRSVTIDIPNSNNPVSTYSYVTTEALRIQSVIASKNGSGVGNTVQIQTVGGAPVTDLIPFAVNGAVEYAEFVDYVTSSFDEGETINIVVNRSSGSTQGSVTLQMVCT